MRSPFIVSAWVLLAIAGGTRTGAQQAQCVSRARGVVFPSPYAYRVPAGATFGRRPPILATPYDRLFRTRIREAARSKPNFAGHYVITSWGCGSGCAQFAIVDRKSGKVFDPPFANVAYHFSQTGDRPDWDCFEDLPHFSVTSRLFVVEGCLDEEKACGRHFYVMQPTGLHEIQYDPDTLPDGNLAPQISGSP